jgi:hypothetical protein
MESTQNRQKSINIKYRHYLLASTLITSALCYLCNEILLSNCRFHKKMKETKERLTTNLPEKHDSVVYLLSIQKIYKIGSCFVGTEGGVFCFFCFYITLDAYIFLNIIATTKVKIVY